MNECDSLVTRARRFALLAALPLLWSLNAGAGLSEDVLHLQQRWEEVNYQLPGDSQLNAYRDLISEADRVTAAEPESAEAWIWSGIIKSSFAGIDGGLGALKWAKTSKSELEKALAIDAGALNGSAYTSLGILYAKVPGWPIGFGNQKKAEELLKTALIINPDGIDSNYFYADFLASEHRYREARDYLLKAQSAAPRPDRKLADAGRQKEIRAKLAEVEAKLGS
jgi:tetratricopeptide (TPR) repeat protein